MCYRKRFILIGYFTYVVFLHYAWSGDNSKKDDKNPHHHHHPKPIVERFVRNQHQPKFAPKRYLDEKHFYPARLNPGQCLRAISQKALPGSKMQINRNGLSRLIKIISLSVNLPDRRLRVLSRVSLKPYPMDPGEASLGIKGGMARASSIKWQ